MKLVRADLELLNSPARLDDIRQGLRLINKIDFESILSKLGKKAGFEQKATFLLQLRQMLLAVTPLVDCMGQSCLLSTIKEVGRSCERELIRNSRIRVCRGLRL